MPVLPEASQPLPGETPTVRRARPTDAPDWDAFVRTHPDGTVYHTTGWARVGESVFGHVPVFLEARGADDRVVGVLPSYRVTSLLGRRLISVPFRDRGGPLAETDEAARALVEAAGTVARDERCAYLELRCLRQPAPRALPADMLTCAHWINTVVPLSAIPREMWTRLRDNARGPVTQARKAGVTVRWGAPDDLAAFHRLFLATRRRLGVPAYPLRFFRSLWDHLPAGTVRLLMAEHGDRLIGGLVLFVFGSRVIEGYAASEQSAWRLRGNDLLVWHALEWSGTAGYREYDFGADSPHQEGLLAFKRKWGGESAPVYNCYALYRRRRVPLTDTSTGRYRVVRRLWALLPAPLYGRLSTALVRQLS